MRLALNIPVATPPQEVVSSITDCQKNPIDSCDMLACFAVLSRQTSIRPELRSPSEAPPPGLVVLGLNRDFAAILKSSDSEFHLKPTSWAGFSTCSRCSPTMSEIFNCQDIIDNFINPHSDATASSPLDVGWQIWTIWTKDFQGLMNACFMRRYSEISTAPSTSSSDGHHHQISR